MPGPRLDPLSPRPTKTRHCPARQAILELIHADEGINKSTLMDRLGLGWGTISYHLVRLERIGAIQMYPHGRTALAFPADRSPHHMHVVAVRRRNGVLPILDLLRHQTELNIPTILERTGLSRHVAKSCLEEMEHVGIIQRIGRGHARYRAADAPWTSPQNTRAESRFARGPTPLTPLRENLALKGI